EERRELQHLNTTIKSNLKRLRKMTPNAQQIENEVMSASEKLRELTTSNIDHNRSYAHRYLRKNNNNGLYQTTDAETPMVVHYDIQDFPMDNVQFDIIFPKPYIELVDPYVGGVICSVNPVPFSARVGSKFLNGYIEAKVLLRASFAKYSELNL
ncbi:hypothetical protein HK097_005482, partial [Rhizophlyctis rosea]